MNKIFDICVNLMVYGAARLGVTYKELNVWLFVIIQPSVIFVMFLVILYLWFRLRKLRRLERCGLVGR